MAFTADDVPPGPYFHGTRCVLADGTPLRPRTVDPSAGDERNMVWATTDPDAALGWARRRYPSMGDMLYVYEVELIDAEVDTNHHRDWETGAVTSVMAPSGIVVRLLRSAHATN